MLWQDEPPMSGAGFSRQEQPDIRF